MSEGVGVPATVAMPGTEEGAKMLVAQEFVYNFKLFKDIVIDNELSLRLETTLLLERLLFCVS